jgi:hypothetical protein
MNNDFLSFFFQRYGKKMAGEKMNLEKILTKKILKTPVN